MKLTEESLRDVCLTKKLYRTPNVNDKLWLHYMGISKLENLEEYSVRQHLRETVDVPSIHPPRRAAQLLARVGTKPTSHAAPSLTLSSHTI